MKKQKGQPKTATAKHALGARPSGNGETVSLDQDGFPQMEIWLEDETFWLSLNQIAALFGCSDENIRLHLKNIFTIGELDAGATSKDFLEVRLEGSRKVSRRRTYYNLDVLISVGYRVNSIKGVRFRQWASNVLKEYLLRGSVRDQRINKLESRVTAAERSIDAIVHTLMPPLTEKRRKIGFHATND